MHLNVLTPQELYTLTKYKRKAEQKQWLKENGVFFLEASDGYPNVSLDYVNSMLGVNISASAKKKVVLDIDAIKDYGKNNVPKSKKK